MTPHECPQCDGKGGRRGNAPPGDDIPEWIFCSACNGSGTLYDHTVIEPIWQYEIHTA